MRSGQTSARLRQRIPYELGDSFAPQAGETVRRAETPAPEVTQPLPRDSVDDEPISDDARAWLFGLASRHDVGGLDPHAALHHILAKLWGKPADEVSVKDITFTQLLMIVEKLTEYPVKETPRPPPRRRDDR